MVERLLRLISRPRNSGKTLKLALLLSIRTNKWTDKAGIERYGVEVICENLQLLGSRPHASQAGRTETESYGGFSQSASENASAYASTEFDEDIIPF
jgi:single-stranded DNA-binding protein